jgi:Trypsin-like serine proteases, typically periplasmic, contain C-terminal PDZ domain
VGLRLSRSGGSVGIGFAIPADLVARAVEAALEGDTALSRPWAGIRGQAVDASIAEALGLERPYGVIVAQMDRRSPLAEAGVRPGDVIVALDGEPVDSPEEFVFRMTALGVGGDAEVEYLREGERRAARMALAPRPRN